jgi:hypothetical protein
MKMCFCFFTACGAIMFAVAMDTTIFFRFGRQYGPVLNLYFFDVYGLKCATISDGFAKQMFAKVQFKEK